MVNYKDIVDSSQLDAATTENPDGTFQDYVAGLKPGTPISKSWFQTPYYFFRRLIFEGLGAVPNGVVDNYTDNQAFTALETFTETKVSDRADSMEEAIKNQNIMFNYNKYDFNKVLTAGTFTDDIDMIKFSERKVSPCNVYVSDNVTCGVDNPVAGTTWLACALKEDLKVAVASGKIAYKSDDSSSWVSQDITGNWVNVIYSEYLDLFIAVKDSAYSTSSDGITWTETALTGNWTHLASDDDNGYILLVSDTTGDYTTSSDLSIWSDGSLSDISFCFAMNGSFYIYGDGNLYKGVFQSGGLAFSSISNLGADVDIYSVNPDTNAILLSTKSLGVVYLMDEDGDNVSAFASGSGLEAMGIDYRGSLFLYNDGNIYKL